MLRKKISVRFGVSSLVALYPKLPAPGAFERINLAKDI
jgi:hypothetical protein